MRILLLEDDKQLGPWIATGLREEGHVVDHFDDGKDALIAAMGQEFDLLILDRMVPGLDGLAVLKSLRASKDSTPALFLTALAEVDARVEGFEALARWEGEEGLQSPVGDRKGLATSMLIHASEALNRFRKITKTDALFMQVNITSHDLADEQLVDLISALQSGHNLVHGSIRLELTEQDALRDTGQTLSRLHDLRAAGAGIVLDDFGSGHSSFQWLADLPADALKVDASLIAQLDNPRVETILEALTLMSRRLGMTSTAEGVEDEAMMPRLRTLGFDHAQGFALGRPMSIEKMEAFLTA